jgi:hypothetical protein
MPTVDNRIKSSMARANRRISERRNGIEPKGFSDIPALRSTWHEPGESTLATRAGIHRKMG